MATTTLNALPETTSWANNIDSVFKAQKANQYAIGSTTASERKVKLKKLLDTVIKYRTQIQEAAYKDFKKAAPEVDLTEVYVMTTELKHTISNLAYWMNPKSVGVPEGKLVLGKHSGRHALANRCQDLGFELTKEELQVVYTRFTTLADTKKGVMNDEILEMIAEVRAGVSAVAK